MYNITILTTSCNNLRKIPIKEKTYLLKTDIHSKNTYFEYLKKLVLFVFIQTCVKKLYKIE